MLKAKFLSQHSDWDWPGQIPAPDAVVGQVQFLFDVHCKDYDYLIVYDDLPPKFAEQVEIGKTIFVAPECQTIYLYNNQFLQQFGTVIGPNQKIQHPNFQFMQPGSLWFLGVSQPSWLRSLGYADIQALNPKKTKLASVICSNKTVNEGHIQRLKFVEQLQRNFGDEIDFFGQGFNEIEDKQEGMLPYQYHIALENTSMPEYWTEKLADAFLARCFPIYWGCTNIEKYFPKNSFATININHPKQAIHTIAQLFKSNQAQASQSAVAEARNLVLEKYNIFNMLEQQIVDLEKYPLVLKHSTVQSFAASSKVVGSSAQIFRRKARLKLAKHSPFLLKIALSLWQAVHFCIFIKNNPVFFCHKHLGGMRKNYDYPLSSTSLVWDVGGYLGGWSQQIHSRFQPQMVIFEPMPRYAARLKKRFLKDAKVQVQGFGLSDKNEKTFLNLSDDSTSVFLEPSKHQIQVEFKDVHQILEGYESVDLAQLNMEGGEYAVLDRLIETGSITKLKYLLVQFHAYSSEDKNRYQKIKKGLLRTHQLMWRYPFIWESWKLK